MPGIFKERRTAMMNIKSPLQIQAYDYIKDSILSGKLEGGVLYSETKLAKEFGISRTPMREALQCLAQDGYITITPSKGFMIRQLNEQDMSESIQVRCAIEGFCTHVIAAEAGSKKAQRLFKQLAKLLENQEKAVSLPDGHESFMSYDHQFHLALVNYVDNEEFNQIFQRLMYLIHLTTSTSLSVPGRIEETLKEHREFYELLASGDGDGSYRLLVRHLSMPIALEIAKK